MQDALGIWCDSTNYTTGAENQTCLWSYRTAHETLWEQWSYVIFISNLFYFGTDFFDSTFRLFLNQSNPRQAHNLKTNMTNYGLGINCSWIESIGGAIGGFCSDPATTGADIRHIQKTGRDDLNNVAEYVAFYGNNTIYEWNMSAKSGVGELVRGTDHFQFKPYLSESDTLTIFDDLLFRHVDLIFQKEHSYLDVTMWRYIVTDDLFASGDPFYFGDTTPKGFFYQLHLLRKLFMALLHLFLLQENFKLVWILPFVHWSIVSIVHLLKGKTCLTLPLILMLSLQQAKLWVETNKDSSMPTLDNPIYLKILIWMTNVII